MKQISIYLGNQCNANCAYCHREGSVDQPFSTPMLQYLQQAASSQPMAIRFMGGEPTLYLSEIKQVLATCRSSASYSLSTNGLLLNDPAIASFLLDNQFAITISYDGAQGKRGYENILTNTDYFEHLRKFKHISISTTLDKDNLDFAKLMTEFGQISNVLKSSLRLYPHTMHVTNDKNRSSCLSLQDAHNYADQWIGYVDAFIRTFAAYGVINLKTLAFFSQLWRRYQRPYKAGETYCVNSNLLKMDTQGNYYACLYIRDRRTYLGNIEQGETTALYNLHQLVEKITPQCSLCSLHQYCGCACIMSQDHHIECAIQKKILTWFLNEITQYPPQYFSPIDKIIGSDQYDKTVVCI